MLWFGLSGLWKKKQLDEPWQLIPFAVTYEEAARAIKTREDKTTRMFERCFWA